MSQPHMSKDLSFVKHPSKRYTYLPGSHTPNRILGFVTVCLGAALLGYGLSILLYVL